MTPSMQKVTENERKYDVADEARLPDPPFLLGVDINSTVEEQQLDAVYFDTQDLRLARAGITLRRREGGSDAGWHLKLPVDVDSRDELRVPLGRARRTPPAQLTSLIRVHTRGAKITPVVQLRTLRRRWLLANPDGRPLGEVVEDRVTAHTLGRSTEATSWREIEVELAEHGTPTLLDRIEESLLAAGARRSEAASKLNRVLADRLAEDSNQPVTGAPDSAGQVVLGYLRTQAEALRRNDLLVRQDAPDSVHRMRVASRRMRSALQAYRRLLDRQATRPLTEELKWLANELAPARDTEVMAGRFARMLDELPPELVLGPVSTTLDRTFARQQNEARKRALAALDSDRYLALHDAIDATLAAPPLTQRADNPAHRELPGNVRRAFRRTRRYMAAVTTQPASQERDTALHETRKAAKRLRYATEAAEPALGKPAGRLRKRLKPVQKLLGDHQDTVVARPVLRELGARAHLDGGNGFTFGLLHGIEAARAERAEHNLPDRWKRMTKPRNTSWMKG
jgi:CHAD domain-containing protein